MLDLNSTLRNRNKLSFFPIFLSYLKALLSVCQTHEHVSISSFIQIRHCQVLTAAPFLCGPSFLLLFLLYAHGSPLILSHITNTMFYTDWPIFLRCVSAHYYQMVQIVDMCEAAQSCLTLCIPLHCSPPGSSVHGVFQARLLEWAAMPSSKGSSRPRDWPKDRTQVSPVSCTGRKVIYLSCHLVFILLRYYHL